MRKRMGFSVGIEAARMARLASMMVQSWSLKTVRTEDLSAWVTGNGAGRNTLQSKKTTPAEGAKWVMVPWLNRTDANCVFL